MSLPSVPDSFRWTTESWGAALRCEPLAAIAPHLFTTRQLPLTSSVAWARVAAAIGARELVTVSQVHRADVVVVRAGWQASATREDADVLVSDAPEPAIAVRAADCVPLLMADSVSGAVAAVHAGWRGTATGAARAAVKALTREFGARPADLVVAIGPSIGACCYEVRTELVDAFAAAGHARHLVDRWFVTVPPRRGERGASGLRLDLWAANRDQLMLSGVPEENIHTSGLCTASNLDIFPSYRAEGESAGRLAAVIRAR